MRPAAAAGATGGGWVAARTQWLKINTKDRMKIKINIDINIIMAMIKSKQRKQ